MTTIKRRSGPMSKVWCWMPLVLSVALVAQAGDDVPVAEKRPAAPATAASNTAPFPVDHDAPLDPTEKTDRITDTYTRLRVEFNGIRKDRVPAYLYLPTGAGGGFKPTNDGKRRPAILLQYGSGGNKNTNYIVALGEQFVKRGFVVLTIDVPKRGERKPKTIQGG